MTRAAKQIRALIPSAWEVHLTEWNMHGEHWNMTSGAAITTATWIGVQNATDAAFLCVLTVPTTVLAQGVD